MGGEPAVFIGDFDLMKEALNRDEFAGRASFEGYNYVRGGTVYNNTSTPGVIFGWGPKWLNIRRFSLRL